MNRKQSLSALAVLLIAGAGAFLGACNEGSYDENAPKITEVPSQNDTAAANQLAANQKPTMKADDGPTTKPEPPKRNRPQLASVDPDTYPVKVTPLRLDLGEIPAGESGKGIVKVVNTGPEPVKLSQCKTSCGCTTTNCPRGKQLQPDEAVEIEVSLKGGTTARAISKKVTLIFNETDKMEVTVSGETVTFVEVTPQVVDPERHADGQIILRATDEQPFRIVRMLPAVLDASSFSPDPQLEHVIYLDWERWEEMGRNRKISFELDHPKAKRVYATIRWYPQKNQQGKPGLNTGDARASITAPSPAALGLERTIMAGASENLMKQLDAGDIELETTDQSGSSLLALAAKHGKIDIMQALIKRGANLDATDQMGRTPMMTATRAKNPEIIKVLLEAGASIDPQDMLGSSALSWAAGFGDSKSVHLLIDAGSDLEASGAPTGFTPLIWASAFGDPEAVRELIEAGANSEAQDLTHGMTPLMHAARTGGAQKIAILAEGGANLEARDSAGKTPLLVAAGASGATVDMVRALVDAGADLKAVDDSGRNALELARSRTDPSSQAVFELLESIMGEGN
ncbi:MAG: ankyrin repeat domain-containing protein [Planctomycetota bacterium]|jgi:ankyrin repeat protein